MEVKNMAYWKRKNGVPEFDNAPTKFNAGLRKASAEGKLDDNPKFKAAVDNAGDSPNKFLGMGRSPSEKANARANREGPGIRGIGKALLNPVGAIANKMGAGDTALGKALNPLGSLFGRK